MAKEGLSHTEVWDDSALVSSWNEALSEYKKYHSIAAKGEKVALVVENAQKAENVTVEKSKSVDHADFSKKEEVIEAGPADVSRAAEEPTSSYATPVPAANIPQTVLSGVQDENLKNLMMSWYYAGYYTGLYEGKQQAFTTLHPAE